MASLAIVLGFPQLRVYCPQAVRLHLWKFARCRIIWEFVMTDPESPRAVDGSICLCTFALINELTAVNR